MYLWSHIVLMACFHCRLKQTANLAEPPRCVTYALQKLLKEELEWLYQQDIIIPIGIDKTAEWCNCFALLLKPNGRVMLCLYVMWLNETLIWPVHRGPILNDIFPKLTNAKYLSLIDASLKYHNLRLEEKSSYLTTFSCQLGRYRYKWLPFGEAPAGNMFQGK